MNKLIIFDLDGVLIDSRELHYSALNEALSKIDKNFIISKEEHLAVYDALTTKRKLELLTVNKGLEVKHYDQIWSDKQKSTMQLIKQLPKNQKLIQMFADIADKGIKIAVASNSIRNTVKTALLSIGVLDYVDYFISNEDVRRAKPNPEMYWRCMIMLNSLPKNTVIIEDSHIGRQAVMDSGANLVSVKDPDDVTKEKIDTAMTILENNNSQKVPWKNNKMNVLIPMAGAGTRFASVGYTFPKPLVDVHGKPMIQVVVENLNIEAHYIFLVKKEHYGQYNLQQLLNMLAPGCDIIQIESLTQGAACTTLLSKDLINNEQPLLIANSDQYVEWNSNECLYAVSSDKIDGDIVTFKSMHPKWSFAKLGDNGLVSEVAEKNPISDNATVGIYYWKHGKDYVRYAEQMIGKNIRVNNEFYVCPVYNEAIQDGKNIKIKQVDKMWGLGTPEDLEYYINNCNNAQNT